MSAAQPTSRVGAGSNDDVKARLIRLVSSARFAWFIGHFFVFLLTPLYGLKGEVSFYYYAIAAASFTYGLLLFQEFKIESAKNAQKAQAAASVVRSLNFQYFFLSFAFYWARSPCFPLLVPYFSYSSFHSLRYLSDSVIPALLPTNEYAKKFSATVQRLDVAVQPRLIELAVTIESIITPMYLVWQILTGWQSFLMIFAYFQFLCGCYINSSMTRCSFARFRHGIDSILLPRQTSDGGAMNILVNVWIRIRDFLISLGNSILSTSNEERTKYQATSDNQREKSN